MKWLLTGWKVQFLLFLFASVYVAEVAYTKSLKPEQFRFTKVAESEREVPSSVQIVMGDLQSNLLIIQRQPEGGFSSKNLLKNETYFHSRSNLHVRSTWHLCSPVTMMHATPIDQTGGGEGVADVCTSGGGIELRLDGEDRLSTVIEWSLVGTSLGYCRVQIEPLVESQGKLLRAMTRLRDDLKEKSQESSIDLASYPWVEISDGMVTFHDAEGVSLGSTTVKNAVWLLQMKGAFRKSYEDPSQQHIDQVTLLVLDYILQDKTFQREAAFGLRKLN